MSTNPTFFENELLAYVAKRVKNRSVAEDIVHDVYLKVISNLGQVKDNDKMVGWIYRIARNAIIDYFRFQSRTVDPLDLDWDDEAKPLNQCVERCIVEKLSSLPPMYRDALQFSEMEGLSQLELAKRLNISYSGAKSRVQRARQMLKDALERDYRVKLDGYGNVLRCERRVPCNC